MEINQRPAVSFLPTGEKTRRTLFFFKISIFAGLIYLIVDTIDTLRLTGILLPDDIGVSENFIRWIEYGSYSVSLIELLAYVASGFLFLSWNYWTVSNLKTFQLDSTGKISPRWAIIWWFIPVLGIFMAYRSIGNAWRGSQPDISNASVGPRWPVLGLFWAIWLTMNFLDISSAFFLDTMDEAWNGNGEDQSALLWFYSMNLTRVLTAQIYIGASIIYQILLIWTYFLVRTIMGEIDKLQEQRHASITFA